MSEPNYEQKDPQIDEPHPSVRHVLQYFTYDHLPDHLQQVSIDFHNLAHKIASAHDGPEVTVALRKLLEAKDAAVRASLKKGD